MKAEDKFATIVLILMAVAILTVLYFYDRDCSAIGGQLVRSVFWVTCVR